MEKGPLRGGRGQLGSCSPEVECQVKSCPRCSKNRVAPLQARRVQTHHNRMCSNIQNVFSGSTAVGKVCTDYLP
jgi:hypothetical protein